MPNLPACKDDDGTYRSLDVARKSGGGKAYTGDNTATKGGRLDQLAANPGDVKLRKDEERLAGGPGSRSRAWA